MRVSPVAKQKANVTYILKWFFILANHIHFFLKFYCTWCRTRTEFKARSSELADKFRTSLLRTVPLYNSVLTLSPSWCLIKHFSMSSNSTLPFILAAHFSCCSVTRLLFTEPRESYIFCTGDWTEREKYITTSRGISSLCMSRVDNCRVLVNTVRLSPRLVI